MAERRRSYSHRTKAEVVGLAEVVGGRAAARQSGVPESTLRRWRESDEMTQLRAEKREEVVADVWAAFQKGVRRSAELMDTTEDLAKVATAAGILYDKFALMNGDPTGRTEHRDLTEGWDDHEKMALRDAIRDELAKREVLV
jgi:transposase-like protein